MDVSCLSALLSPQPVGADGRPPRDRFCQQVLDQIKLALLEELAQYNQGHRAVDGRTVFVYCEQLNLHIDAKQTCFCVVKYQHADLLDVLG